MVITGSPRASTTKAPAPISSATTTAASARSSLRPGARAAAVPATVAWPGLRADLELPGGLVEHATDATLELFLRSRSLLYLSAETVEGT